MQQGIQQGVQQGLRQGLRQGVHQGQAGLLRRQAERRFGAETARQLSAALDGADADRLNDVGDWIVECGSGDELLERLNRANAKG